jgi:hypothetical protein
MRTVWWTLLVVEVVLLAFALLQRRSFRRREVSMPQYMVGGVWSSAGMILLIVSYLVGLDSPIGTVAMAGSFVCIALAIWQSTAAWRRNR